MFINEKLFFEIFFILLIDEITSICLSLLPFKLVKISILFILFFLEA